MYLLESGDPSQQISYNYNASKTMTEIALSDQSGMNVLYSSCHHRYNRADSADIRALEERPVPLPTVSDLLQVYLVP